MGRRSEAADHPLKGSVATAEHGQPPPPTLAALHLRPLILVSRVEHRQGVTAAGAVAGSLGLAPGMAATQARALVAGLDVRPAEPEADERLLERLALHAVRHWSPSAAAGGAGGGIWLDLTGTTHLFGGEERFCRRVVRFLWRLGLTARIVVADTPGAAHALARFSAQHVVVIPMGAHAQAIAALPVAALRLADGALAAAARFGLE